MDFFQTIKAKILALLILAMIIVGLNATVTGYTNRLKNLNNDMSRQASAIQINVLENLMIEAQYISSREPGFLTRIAEIDARFKAVLKAMEGLSSNKEAREFIKKLDMAYGNYQGVFKQITQWDISKKLEKDLANAVAEVRDLAKSLNQLTETEILRYEKIGSRLTLTFLAVGLLAFIIIGGLIANSIVKPLNNVVHGLRDAAQQIERVIETITEISEQVSLLALNATIESARAGEAGKGFAVVAYEIKELAKQTANASGQIRQNIEAIQTSTTDSIKEINAISRVVGDVNQIVSTISAAIEEQSITTRDISENVAQASTAVNDISSEISMVTAASGRMSTSSTQVNSNSMELSKLARQLNTIVTRFKI